MELNDAAIDRLLDGLMMTAKYQREKIPYSRDEAFTNVLVFIGPNGEAVTQPITWADENEKYMRMQAVSIVAKEMLCRAVVLVTDTRWTNADDLHAFLGIPSVAEMGLKEWGKHYSRILRERFDGQIKNMPHEYWHEAICVVMKGPEFKGKIPTRMAEYERGPNDRVRWVAPKPGSSFETGHFNLLPDWWC
jgi:hypothetical protein